MAIKSLIQMFASFLGYELPDSSGSTGSILDSMDDSLGGVSDGMDDVNAGIDDANSGLDSAKKKTKEWKNFLAGFDVANVIPDQSTDDSSSGSGGGGSSNAGGMSIDPRLLKALQDMDYIFDNIRMKAMDIRDQLLEWANILGKVVDDNIFEPIRNSWNKYGTSIGQNMQEIVSNIKYMWMDFFEVVGRKWKPFFQALSDLFFSLLDTATLVLTTIQKFFRHVWDSGGKYLFEALWDLATALLKLATSINDNFVKPVVNWFKRSIAPAFGDLVGTILKGVGKIVKGFANIITWIAKCKPVVITLTSVFAAFFLTLKIAKMVELISSIKETIAIYGGLREAIKIVMMKFISGNSTISSVKTAFGTLNALISNTGIWKTFSGFIGKASDKLFELGDNMIESGGAMSGLAGTIVGKLGAAFNWLAANPVVAVVAGITAVVAGIALLGATQKEKKYEMDDYSKSVQEQIKAVDDLKESLDQAKESAKNQEKDRLAELGAVETHVKKLQDLAGESGYVDNIQLANEHIKAINKELPESVKLTKDGRVEWSKMPSEIYKNIEALKEKARVEAYSALYTEAIKTQIKAQNEQTVLQEQLNRLKKEETDLMKKVGEGTYEQRSEASERLKQVKADIDGTTKAIDKNKNAADKANKSVDAYEKSLSNMGESSKDAAGKLQLSYSKMSDAGNAAMNSLGTKMKEVTRQHEELVSQGKTLNDKELQQTQETKNQLIDEYAKKAVGFEKSYEDMLIILEQQGIKLTDEEKNHLENSIKNYQTVAKEKESIKKDEMESILSELKKGGKKLSKEDKAQADSLIKAYKNNKKNAENIAKGKNESLYKLFKAFGIDLSKEQKKQLDDYLKQEQKSKNDTIKVKKQQNSELLSLLDKLGIDKDSKLGKQYQAELEKAQKNGTKSGEDYIKNIKKGIDSGDISPEAQGQWNKGQKIFDNPLTALAKVMGASDAGKGAYGTLVSWIVKTFTGKVSTSGASTAGSNAASDIKGKIKNLPGSVSKYMGGLSSAWSYVKSWFSGKAVTVSVDFVAGKVAANIKGALKITTGWFADGGFPDIGQMFIAREAGPELVGTMGGRTAVANNDQITSGIYRAVLQALRDGGGFKERGGDLYITIQNEDGSKTTKIIKDYKKQMIFSGGKGGVPV